METTAKKPYIELVGYNMKPEFELVAKEYLKQYLVRNKLLKKGRIIESSFSVGSAFHDVITKSENLDLWCTPIFREYKTITFKRAKSLQESIALFTGEFTPDDLNEPWILTTEDGLKHPESDRLVLAYKQYQKALKEIKSVLFG